MGLQAGRIQMMRHIPPANIPAGGGSRSGTVKKVSISGLATPADVTAAIAAAIGALPDGADSGDVWTADGVGGASFQPVPAAPGLPYEEVVFQATQTGTTAPTIDRVVSNPNSRVINLAYVGVGEYTLEVVANGFSNTLMIFTQQTVAAVLPTTLPVVQFQSSSPTAYAFYPIQTYLHTLAGSTIAFSNDVLFRALFVVRLYPNP